MSKTNKALLIIFMLLSIGCFIVRTTWAAYFAGAFHTMILLVIIGQRQANKAASRIDKKIHDAIYQTGTHGNSTPQD